MAFYETIDKKYYILYGENMENERTIQRLFEWDYEKEQRNIKIHKISFETAKLVFNDDNRIEFFDVNHSDMEDRLITIGKVDKVLFVVYTERGDKTRIISARPANQQPRRRASGYVVLIRWLQSTLIPFVTTQSVGVLKSPHE